MITDDWTDDEGEDEEEPLGSWFPQARSNLGYQNRKTLYHHSKTIRIV